MAIIEFSDFVKVANDALVNNPSGEKSVIKIGVNTENDTYTIGTQEWQPLGSRSDDYKKDNRQARAQLLSVLMEKYGASQADRLPKAVLDALNLSDFCLDKEGKVTSQRPLTARRIIAINNAIEKYEEKKDNSLAQKLDEARATKNAELTAETDWNWTELFEISSKYSNQETKGKTLLIFDKGVRYRYAEGTEDSFGDLNFGIEKIDTRFGARLALFQDLLKAGGWLDENFVRTAIAALKLDSHNPVYEDLPLAVAKDLIDKVIEIREKNNDKIAKRQQVEVKGVAPRLMDVEVYKNFCKSNIDFLKKNLSDVVKKLKEELEVWKSYQIPASDDWKSEKEQDEDAEKRLSNLKTMCQNMASAIQNLEKDLKGAEKKSGTFMRLAKVLCDKKYVDGFMGGHSDVVRLEFLVEAAQGLEKQYTSHGRLVLSGWKAEDHRNGIRVSPNMRPIVFKNNVKDPMSDPEWLEQLVEGKV